MSFSIREGDTVKIIAGREKGKTGKVLKILKEKNRALIEKLNMVKKHSRPSKKSPQGGIIEKEASIHISNLMYFHEKSGGPVRIGAKVDGEGGRVRIFRSKGKEYI